MTQLTIPSLKSLFLCVLVFGLLLGIFLLVSSFNLSIIPQTFCSKSLGHTFE